jgi:flavin-dependent dehydrogenase
MAAKITHATVIGAGVAGSAAAIALRKIANVPHVRLFDTIPKVNNHVGAGFVLVIHNF